MIRNFLYMDSGKLRSISSQLFEGVADSILKRDTHESVDTNSQKGPLGSGEVLADIFRKEASTAQTFLLEDYAYTLFEQEIAKVDKVLEVSSDLVDEVGRDKPFAKVTGKLSINDTKVLSDMFDGYNQLGADLTRVTHNDMLNAKALGKPISKKDVEKLAMQNDLQMDSDLSAALNRLIQFSAKGMLEFQINANGISYSAPMKREFLREREDMLIQKYSRYTETEFTIFGLVTQSGKNIGQEKPLADVKDATNLKTALRNLSGHFRSLEDTLAGLSEGEIVLDPIAVYQTL